MNFTYLYLLPVLAAIWSVAALGISYFISVYLEHTEYISYFRTWYTALPESCIFAVCFDIAIILYLFVTYVRFLHVKVVCEKFKLEPRTSKLNLAALYLQLVALFGLSLVSHFQINNSPEVNFIGGVLGFGLMIIYHLLQSILTYQVYPYIGKHWIFYFRMILVVVDLITFMSSMGCLYKGMSLIPKGEQSLIYHNLGVSFGGIELLSHLMFLLSYSVEFHEIYITEPVIDLY